MNINHLIQKTFSFPSPDCSCMSPSTLPPIDISSPCYVAAPLFFISAIVPSSPFTQSLSLISGPTICLIDHNMGSVNGLSGSRVFPASALTWSPECVSFAIG